MLIGLSGLTLAGARGGDDSSGGDPPAGLTCSITISGSSTVSPSARCAELFNETTRGDITVDGPGTGDGFALFCAGRDRHRRRVPADRGRGGHSLRGRRGQYTELEVALDGITVMVNREPASSLRRRTSTRSSVRTRRHRFDGQAIASPSGSAGRATSRTSPPRSQRLVRSRERTTRSSSSRGSPTPRSRTASRRRTLSHCGGLHVLGERQRDHPGDGGSRTRSASLGSRSPRRSGRRDQGGRGRRRRRMRLAVRGDHLGRQLPTVPAAVHLPQHGHGRENEGVKAYVDFYLTDDGPALAVEWPSTSRSRTIASSDPRRGSLRSRRASRAAEGLGAAEWRPTPGFRQVRLRSMAIGLDRLGCSRRSGQLPTSAQGEPHPRGAGRTAGLSRSSSASASSSR